MKYRHTPYHWIAVALVLVALLLTLSEVHGQSVGGNAAFEGRPAMAGAQAGEGAMAGPPQGGIGVQGTTGLGQAIDPKPAPRDPGMAKSEGSVIKKSKRAAKRVAKRSRTGVGDIDTVQ